LFYVIDTGSTGPGPEIDFRVHGDSHLDVATSYNNVAIIYEAQGKYEEALEMHAKSLDIRTRILGGDNHLDVATSLGNLGQVWMTWGSLKRRLFTCKRVLRLCSSSLGAST
jgi:tetratricopeptide (TPR) repeat protein